MSESNDDNPGPVIVAGPIGFEAQGARYGDRRRWERIAALDTIARVLGAGGRQSSVPMGFHAQTSWVEEVIGVAAGVPTAKRFVFGRARRVTLGQGPEREVAEPFEDRVYEVSLADGDAGAGLLVTRADGETPTSAASQHVRRMARMLGRQPVLQRYAGDVEFEPGRPVPLALEDAADFFGIGEGLTPTAAEAIYRGAGKVGKRLVGFFDVSVAITGSPSPSLDLQAELSGLVAVDALTSLRVSATVEGPVTLSGRRGLTTFSGTGTMKMHDRSVFE